MTCTHYIAVFDSEGGGDITHQGRHYSLVNNVQGDTIHSDTGNLIMAIDQQ